MSRRKRKRSTMHATRRNANSPCPSCGAAPKAPCWRGRRDRGRCPRCRKGFIGMLPRECREGRCTDDSDEGDSKRDRSTRSDGRFVPVEGQPGLLVDPLTGARYRASGDGLLYVGLGSSNGTPSPRANGAGLRPVRGQPGLFVDTATGERIGLDDMRMDDVHPKARRFGCQWVAPWNIDWPLRAWAFAWAPNTESWFVRILGLELSLRKDS